MPPNMKELPIFHFRMKFQKRRNVLRGLLCLLICINHGCEKSYTGAESILLPAGRIELGPGSIEILLNDQRIEPELIYDQCGGYWHKIPAEILHEGDDICIRYLSRDGDTSLFKEEIQSSGKWKKASYYIDSDHKEIIQSAKELISGIDGAYNRARNIQLFVITNIEKQIYNASFKDRASESLSLGYGTCMNFSRLFVALCRAVDIPARTVWGVVYNHEDNGIFDYHHQWAEFQDENGFWHPLDFGYTTAIDFDDLRYIDLLYGAEENPLLRDRFSNYVVLGDVKYFKDYPAPLSGMLGFMLEEDNRPKNMVITYTFHY